MVATLEDGAPPRARRGRRRLLPERRRANRWWPRSRACAPQIEAGIDRERTAAAAAAGRRAQCARLRACGNSTRCAPATPVWKLAGLAAATAADHDLHARRRGSRGHGGARAPLRRCARAQAQADGRSRARPGPGPGGARRARPKSGSASTPTRATRSNALPALVALARDPARVAARTAGAARPRVRTSTGSGRRIPIAADESVLSLQRAARRRGPLRRHQHQAGQVRWPHRRAGDGAARRGGSG